MTQYDILLTQNTASSGTEFEAKVVNIPKGGLLSSDVSQVPTVLNVGTDGYVLVADSGETTGLKWVDPSTISTGVVVANQSNDRLITATATSNSLNAEQYLTYNTTDGLGVLAGNGIVFGSAATIWKIYTPDGAYANGLEISTGANSGGAAGDLTLKAGSGTSSGGNVYLRRDTTYGNFYFGTGSAGHLPAKASETDIVYYNSTSGKISYGSVPTGDVTASSYTQYDLAVWDSTTKNLVDTAGKLTWNSTVFYADTTTTEIKASSSISLSSPYVYLGSSAFTGGSVRVEAIGTSADIDIYLSPKGDGYLELGNGGPIGMVASQVQIYSSVIGIGNTTTDVLMYAQPGGSGHVTGFALTLKGGNAYNTGDNDGGNVYIYGGSPNGSGDFGNIYFGNGGLGLLPAKSAETNVVYYDTTTGLLSYGVAAGSMTYPGAGIAVSNGSAWGTSLGIANNTNNYVVTMTGSGLNGEANLQFDGTAMSLPASTTQTRAIEIGLGRSGNGSSYIDLIGDATYTDYGLRLIRGNGGANTTSDLMHRGTGDFRIVAVDAANLLLKTQATTRMTIGSDGYVGIGITPIVDFHVSKSSAAGSVISIVANTDNTNTSSHASSQVRVGGSNSGDPKFQAIVDGVTRWNWGIDNSDSDKFKISSDATGALGTSTVMAITTAGSMSIYGALSLDTPDDYDQTAVTSLTTAPIVVPRVNVGGISSFLPFLHQSAQHSGGYVTHMNLGLYKQANAFGTGTTGFYVALGGNDNYPTEYFTLAYGGSDGGYIKHSSNKLILPNSVGIGRTPGTELDVYAASGACGVWSAATTTNYGYYRIVSGSTKWDMSVRDNEYSAGFQIRYAGSSAYVLVTTSGALHTYGTIVGSSSTLSDIRLKTEVEEITDGLSYVMKMRPVQYELKYKQELVNGKQKQHYGFIAQEMEYILPNIIDETELPLQAPDNNIYKTIRYTEIIPHLVCAVQELKSEKDIEIENLNKRIVKLEREVIRLGGEL